MLTMIALPVLGNDAGTGGDAGNTSANATNLSATNGTYYGNLTASTDTSDYFSVNMSPNTGISVEITFNSSVDFDLVLQDSAGTQIDSSVATSGTTEEVSSNGTSVGGNVVYIWVDQYSGSGTYTMQIWIFSTGSTGGGGGGTNCSDNDIGSCQDAPGVMSNALNMTVTNTTYQANLSSTNDVDWFAMSIPQDHGIMIEMIHLSSADFDMWLYDSNGNQIDIAYTGLQPENVASNGTNVGGTIVYLQVDDWGSSAPGWYNLTLELFSTSGMPAYNQDDAGLGGDASNDYLNPSNLSITTVLVNNSFTGWGSLNDDLNDNYQTTVPMGHGVAISVWFNSSEVDFQVILADDQAATIDYSSTFNPEYVTSNGSGTYPGMIVEGLDVLVQVRATSGAGYYGMSWWFFSLDLDGDGFYDMIEEDCGSDPEDNNSVPLDTDSDGICDPLDNDDDGDYVEDVNDTFPLDASEWDDTDNDGTGDNADLDDDNDGYDDLTEFSCGSDPLLSNSIPSDFDNDLTCDSLDEDDDNDGYDDISDAFPMDDQEWYDSDNDGIGNNADTDDDGDGFSDNIEITCDSDPLNSFSVPSDFDGDGSCDLMDGDMDGDNYPNPVDAFPLDPTEWFDTDSDGFGNNLDIDDDGDSISDAYDAFPLDASEWSDNENDGLGDNSDLDDDNDGWSDIDEISCNTDPMSSVQIPIDYDNDGICDIVDDDDDNDGVLDILDMFPMDNTEWDDTDVDGIGDNYDDDDDGDNWPDVSEPNCGTDPLDGTSIPLDFDQDWICDLVDNDDDNDLELDYDDAFPKDPSEQRDTDSDGQGDNADNDDDGDGWPDTTEALCFTSSISSNSVPDDTDGDGACDLLDPDMDGDNRLNEVDSFPLDSSEWEDRNNDGKGDNAYPLSITDKMSLNPITTFLILFLLVSMIGGSVLVYTVKKKDSQIQTQAYDMTNYTEGSLEDSDNQFEDILPEAPGIPPMPEMPPMPDEVPPMPEMPPMPDEAPPMPEMPPIPKATPPPPPPPGFEPRLKVEKTSEIVSSWEGLPPGGDYTDTDPLQYVGEGIGTWVERDDESWEKILD